MAVDDVSRIFSDELATLYLWINNNKLGAVFDNGLSCQGLAEIYAPLTQCSFYARLTSRIVINNTAIKKDEVSIS